MIGWGHGGEEVRRWCVGSQKKKKNLLTLIEESTGDLLTH